MMIKLENKFQSVAPPFIRGGGGVSDDKMVTSKKKKKKKGIHFWTA